MKRLEQNNYYEILNLRPTATAFEIRQAYKALLELYGENSIAVYSLLSEYERKKTMAVFEQAFTTLINEQSRSEYDKMLVAAGKLDKNALRSVARREPIPLFSIKRSRVPKNAVPRVSTTVESDPVNTPDVSEILDQDVITGSDLVKIRKALKISLERIAFQTKIRIGLLRFIEGDEFDKFPSMFHLKSFLKSYSQTLNLDPDTIVTKYTKRILP